MKGSRRRWVAAAVAGGLVLVVLIGLEVLRTAPLRQAMRTYAALVQAGNRGDLEVVAALCTSRYLRDHPPTPAPEGGLIGLPRSIHRNFRVWKEGGQVWLCPTNRVGPIFRFVPEGGLWKFDGPVGLLLPGGEVVPYDETSAPG